MPSQPSIRRGRALALLPVLIASCLALAACGSSSSNTTTGSAAAAAGATGPAGRGAAAFAVVRQCLAKNGINLPQRPPGQRRPPGAGAGAGGGIFGGGGGDARGRFGLPPGVTRAQMQAALQKCGAQRFRRGGFRSDPAFKQSLTTFATCMRQNGVNLPPPNVTGTGPVFNTKGINTSSPAFVKASAKCRPYLRGQFGGAGGARSGSTTGGPASSVQ